MKKIILILLTALTLTSCLNDFLSLQPVSQTYSAEFWKTANDAKAAFTSIYAVIQSDWNSNAGLNYINWYEMRSDNFFGNPTGGTYPFNLTNINSMNTTNPSDDWNKWYKAIGTTNYALYYIPGMTNITDAKKNYLLAEAYFLRAYCYFNIIRIWGNAPMVIKPVLTFDDVTYPIRDSSRVIMDSVILKDIKKSMSLVDVSSADIYRFNSGALYALATDIAMWNHNYIMADSCSNILINNAPFKTRYSLVSGANFATVVSTATTSENIWTLKWSFINNGYNQIVNSISLGYALVSKKVKDTWTLTEWRKDLRRPQTIDTTITYPATYLTATQSNGNASMWKYSPGTRIQINTNEKYIPIYRLADIILLRAEALNKLGRYSEALTELNKIRTRAGLKSRLESDYATAADKTLDIETDILQERSFELLGEGKRWFDLMRTGRAMSTMNTYFETYLKPSGVTNYSPFTANWQLYWPVLQDNINSNSNLIQTGTY